MTGSSLGILCKYQLGHCPSEEGGGGRIVSTRYRLKAQKAFSSSFLHRLCSYSSYCSGYRS